MPVPLRPAPGECPEKAPTPVGHSTKTADNQWAGMPGWPRQSPSDCPRKPAAPQSCNQPARPPPKQSTRPTAVRDCPPRPRLPSGASAGRMPSSLPDLHHLSQNSITRESAWPGVPAAQWQRRHRSRQPSKSRNRTATAFSHPQTSGSTSMRRLALDTARTANRCKSVGHVPGVHRPARGAQKAAILTSPGAGRQLPYWHRRPFAHTLGGCPARESSWPPWCGAASLMGNEDSLARAVHFARTDSQTSFVRIQRHAEEPHLSREK